jgi:hypothetical protein
MHRWPGNRILLFGFVIINVLAISLSSPLAFNFCTQLPDSVIWNVSSVTLNFRTVDLFIMFAYKRNFIQFSYPVVVPDLIERTNSSNLALAVRMETAENFVQSPCLCKPVRLNKGNLNISCVYFRRLVAFILDST